MKATFFLLASFLVCTSLGGDTHTFSADVTVRVPNGQYSAKFFYYYNESQQYTRYDYTVPTHMNEVIDYREGLKYKVGVRCEATFCNYTAPILFKSSDDTDTGIIEDGCTKYIPKDTTSTSSLWFRDDGTICKAELADGKTLIFAYVNNDFNDMDLFNVKRVCPAPVCKRAMDVVLVLDSSSSVGERNWNTYIKNFVHQFVSSLDLYSDAAQVGVVSFGAKAREIIRLSTDKELINKTLRRARYTDGDTCISCGIDMAMDMLKNTNTHRSKLDPEKVIVVLAGGVNNAFDPNNTCADYQARCTEFGKKCIKYECHTVYITRNLSICSKYEDSKVCKKYKCDSCASSWGECVSEECTNRDSTSCVKYNESYCTRAYGGCKVSNGKVIQSDNYRCLCSMYRCIEYNCTNYRCGAYECDNCAKYSSNQCLEYEKKCVRNATIKTCTGVETCAEYECSGGRVTCNLTYRSPARILTGSIIRTRTQWALYPATAKLPTVISIGVGSISASEIDAIATFIDGRLLSYKVDSFDQLHTVTQDVIDEICISKVKDNDLCPEGCHGFCGPDRKCYCPACDKETGSCYSIKCESDGKVSDGCVAEHMSCDTDMCATRVADNSTDECCTETKKVTCTLEGASDPDHMVAVCNGNTGECSIEPIKYSIKFEVDKEIVTEMELEYNSRVVYPTLQKEGHTFSRWNETFFVMPDRDIVVTGSWNLNNYTVTFDFDNGTIVEREFAFGTLIMYPGVHDRVGYIFDDWDKEVFLMPAEEITIKALWISNNYTVTFDFDNGTTIEKTYKYKEEIEYPTAIERFGYSFDKWDKILTEMPAEDVTIKALWNFTATENVEIVFSTKGMTEEEAKKIIDAFTDDIFSIEEVHSNSETGDTVVIVKFSSNEKAKNFIDSISVSSIIEYIKKLDYASKPSFSFFVGCNSIHLLFTLFAFY